VRSANGLLADLLMGSGLQGGELLKAMNADARKALLANAEIQNDLLGFLEDLSSKVRRLAK
jgi:hypothetical protein